MTQTTNHAYVVGGGFGGIAAALRLRAKNYQVTLLERGDMLGGRARVFKQDGFTFDAGPSVITAPYLIHELFALFNKDPKDYIELISLEHWYRYTFQDGSHFDYVADMDQLLKNIAAIEPEDAQGFKKLLALAEKIFAKGFVELSDKPFSSFWFMMKQAPALMKLGFYRSVFGAVAKHLKSDKLRRVFTTQPLLVGGDPFRTTSIYLLILKLEHEYGCHFSKGGTHGLIHGLETLMREVGIEIRYQATVTKIHVEHKQTKAITVNDNELINTNTVVFNGDPAYAYNHLLDASARKYWPNLRLRRLKYSMGLCLYYFGTRKKYDDVQLHTISYGDAYKELLQDVFHRQRLNEDLSVYLYRPTAMDATLAPEGCDSFYVLAPVPNLQCGIDWQQYQEPFKKHLIQLLEQRLLPGLSEHIVTEKLLTPDYFANDLLSQFGAAFSIQPIFTQSAYFRFHNQPKDAKGLYFVGAGTHPGAGVPGVLSSAKLVDQLIAEV